MSLLLNPRYSIIIHSVMVLSSDMFIIKKRILFVLLLLLVYSITMAQSLPTSEEVTQVIQNGPDWKVFQLKNRICKVQAELDNDSVDYQICNILLIPLYQKLGDDDALYSTSIDIYNYYKTGNHSQFFQRYKEKDLDRMFLTALYPIIDRACNEEDYKKAESLCQEGVVIAKRVDNHEYYCALRLLADVQNTLGNHNLAYKYIKQCYKKFDNTEWIPGDVTRILINRTYLVILRDLMILSAKSGNIRHTRKVPWHLSQRWSRFYT